MSLSLLEHTGRLNRRSSTIDYDGHGRLESYDRINIGAQSYTYNGLGYRVRVDKPTGTRRVFCGRMSRAKNRQPLFRDMLGVYDAWGRVIAEYGSSASDVKAEFIWALPPAANDNSPFGAIFGGGDHIAGYAPLALVAENGSSQLELYWVHGNHLGVPVVTTNASGQVVTPSNDFLRPGFPGQSQVLSDLYYNRARDYDPVTGRYIQADPIGLLGGSNPYLYANADPINLIDPTGEVYREIGGGLLFGGGNLAYQLYHNGGQWDCVNWWDVADYALLGTGLGFTRSWFAGMLRSPVPKTTRGFTSWRYDAVRKRLRKENGLVRRQVDLHHWLVTQNMMRAIQQRLRNQRHRDLIDRAFNRPWNLNPVNRTFHQQRLNPLGYGGRLIRGAPRPVQGIAGTAAAAGAVNVTEAVAND